jgi:hypothetical protein
MTGIRSFLMKVGINSFVGFYLVVSGVVESRIGLSAVL